MYLVQLRSISSGPQGEEIAAMAFQARPGEKPGGFGATCGRNHWGISRPFFFWKYNKFLRRLIGSFFYFKIESCFRSSIPI